MLDVICHLSLAVFGLIAAAVPVPAQTPDGSGSATFTVLLQGSRIGYQTVSVVRTADGWRVSSVGQLGAPVSFVTKKFELSYGADWQPQQLLIEGVSAGQPTTLSTVFGPTTATSSIMDK